MRLLLPVLPVTTISNANQSNPIQDPFPIPVKMKKPPTAKHTFHYDQAVNQHLRDLALLKTLGEAGRQERFYQTADKTNTTQCICTKLAPNEFSSSHPKMNTIEA